MAIQLVQTQRPMMQQRMIMAPQIIQSLEILQLPLLQLQARIQQELLENPLLEITEAEPDADDERIDTPKDRTQDERISEGEDFAKLDNLDDDFRDYFYQTASRPDPGEKDEKMEALANTPGRPPSLNDYLFEQLRFLDLEPEMRELVEYLVQNLRHDGYLNGTLEDICQVLSPPPPANQTKLALRVLQSLDPPGVGARDLKECLLLQLDAAGEPRDGLAARIVQRHLEDVAANRFPRIQEAVGAPMADVRRAVETIKRLHPAPGSLYDAETSPYVTPDVVVERVDGRYEVHLNDSILPKLRVSNSYRDLLGQDEDAQTRQYLRQKSDNARWFIDTIQQRRNTLLRISQALAEAQNDFLDHGVGHLKPLKMQEVADAAGVHVSTVSRAVRDKFIQTPRGVFPFRFFFAGGVRTGESEGESFNAVKQRIADIVEGEDKAEPLSDEAIMKLMAEQGIEVARRTVTKYRKALGIPSSRQRKQY